MIRARFRVDVSVLLLATCAGYGLAAQTDGHVLPFSLHRGHLILARGEIGAARDLVFLVDTGAGRTVLSRTVTEKLELSGRPAELYSFGQAIGGEELIVPDLALGPLRVQNHAVLATDLSSTASALQMSRLDGIVGIDVLRRSNFAIDYAQKVLRFNSGRSLAHRARLVPHPVLLVVAARVDKQALHLIVDTGASHVALFGFPGDHGTSLSNADKPVHLAGQADVRTILLRRIEVGSWFAEAIPAVVMDAASRGKTGTDGLLGLPALRASFIQFDFQAQEIAWK